MAVEGYYDCNINCMRRQSKLPHTTFLMRTKMNIKKKLIGISLLCSMMLLFAGCGKTADNIIDFSDTSVTDSEAGNDSAEMNLHGADGNMTYTLLDTYIVDAPPDINGMINGSPVYLDDGKGGVSNEISFPKVYDEEGEKFVDGCRLLVAKIKVHNTDAVYHVKNEFSSPYIFRADNLFLCYRDEQGQIHMYENVDYYDKKDELTEGWSAYLLKPGETIVYEVGFLLGDYVCSDRKKDYLSAKETENFYLANTGGDTDGEYYKVSWEKKEYEGNPVK